MHYSKDFGIECRIARFHNIYGPYGTWKGGREKAPAAFCRKVLTSKQVGSAVKLTTRLRLNATSMSCAALLPSQLQDLPDLADPLDSRLHLPIMRSGSSGLGYQCSATPSDSQL